MCGVVLMTYHVISKSFLTPVVEKGFEKRGLFSQHPIHLFLLSRVIVASQCF